MPVHEVCENLWDRLGNSGISRLFCGSMHSLCFCKLAQIQYPCSFPISRKDVCLQRLIEKCDTLVSPLRMCIAFQDVMALPVSTRLGAFYVFTGRFDRRLNTSLVIRAGKRNLTERVLFSSFELL